MSLNEILYKILIQGGSYMTILKGLSATVQISLFSLIFGTLLGAVICALRMSKIRIINTIAAAYIVLLRGSPVLMLLMLMYYGVFARSSLEAQTIAVITFSMNVAAHVAELLRASISATDHGQVEAARTLGFSAWQAFRLITLPQVIRIAKPVYQSTVVNLIQWTSVVGYVSITDLTRVINNIASRTMQPMITIIIGMLIYLA
ncbi:MAG: amino acid ABC transporter permease, partial [Synergistaceae bacterium]|nr:amino acid ABC transporter permease [Synergistaceae bacterium]